jgi:hypothetical protein
VHLRCTCAGQHPDVLNGRKRQSAGAAGAADRDCRLTVQAQREDGAAGRLRAVHATRALRGAGRSLRAGTGLADRILGGGEPVGAGLVGDQLRDTEADELVEGVGDRAG